MDGLIYQPKGSMCRSCKYAKRNCSNLNFQEMPPLGRAGVTVIVKCTGYEQAAKEQCHE